MNEWCWNKKIIYVWWWWRQGRPRVEDDDDNEDDDDDDGGGNDANLLAGRMHRMTTLWDDVDWSDRLHQYYTSGGSSIVIGYKNTTSGGSSIV